MKKTDLILERILKEAIENYQKSKEKQKLYWIGFVDALRYINKEIER